MKNIKNQKNRLLATGLIMALVLVTIPSLSFADNDKNENKIEVKQSTKVKLNKNKDEDSDEHGFFKRLSGWFGERSHSSTLASTGLNISGITAPTVLKVGQEGTWKVNASDPNNGSLSYSVDWGDEDSQLFSRMSQEAFVQTSTFTHTYQNKGAYTVKFTVSNSTGEKANSTVTVYVTSESASLPVISNLSIESVKVHNAKVVWNTDVRSSSMLWISTTSPVNTNIKANKGNHGKVLNHKMNLNRLEPSTTYYVVVGSANKNGRTISSEISFTTPASTDNSPVITSLSGSKTVVVGQTETVKVNAYDPNNDSLTYSVDWGDDLFVKALSVKQPIFIQSSTFEHVYNKAGIYTANFTVENSKGQKTSSSMEITVTENPTDTVAPIISNIATKVSASGSTITWMTNEPATSEVFYSLNTPVDVNLGSTSSVGDKTLKTEHSLEITGLNSSTLYYFVIKSEDGSSNSSLSNENIFVTNL